jgi:hypothetical protein
MAALSLELRIAAHCGGSAQIAPVRAVAFIKWTVENCEIEGKLAASQRTKSSGLCAV